MISSNLVAFPVLHLLVASCIFSMVKDLDNWFAKRRVCLMFDLFFLCSCFPFTRSWRAVSLTVTLACATYVIINLSWPLVLQHSYAWIKRPHFLTCSQQRKSFVFIKTYIKIVVLKKQHHIGQSLLESIQNVDVRAYSRADPEREAFLSQLICIVINYQSDLRSHVANVLTHFAVILNFVFGGWRLPNYEFGNALNYHHTYAYFINK